MLAKIGAALGFGFQARSDDGPLRACGTAAPRCKVGVIRKEYELIPMKTTIRRAGPNEAVPWRLLLSADGPRSEIAKYLARGELWLADCGGDIVGEMVLMETRVDVWEIMNLAVSQSVQRTGIGTRLLRKARTIAKQRRALRLEVGTGNGGVGQLAFYQRFGFRIVGVDTDFFVRRWHKVAKQNGMALRDMVRMEIAFDT